MYPEPESRAEQLDEALERRQSDDATYAIDDEELQELVQLASRLERELPDDLPDPSFRARLKEQILQGTFTVSEPVPGQPVDLNEERWSRRLVASPWRVSAAAAACLVVIAVAFMASTGSFGGSGNGGEEVTSFQPVDADGPDDIVQTGQTALDVDDAAPDGERWFAASFPPFDVEHMVLPPMLIGFLPLSERRKPNVEINDVADMMEDAEMPANATVYYLNAPPDPGTMLTTLQSTLGASGELVDGNGDGDPYRIVDEDGNDVMRWDATSAFFHFRGDLLDNPVNDLLDEGAAPSDVARRFLELIGFDLHTIEYEQQVIQHEDNVEIQIRPIDFPETGLGVTLGGSVFVGDGGSIQEAQLYWLSLVDIEVVPLRDVAEIIADVENGQGYTPPTSDDSDQLMIDVNDLMIVHVLTRLGEANFVLQPAVKLVGDYGDDVASALPGPARYLVPAAGNSD